MRARSLHADPVIRLLIALILITLCSVASHARNDLWRRNDRIWDDVIHNSPRKARGHIYRGIAYYHLRRLDEAAGEFRTALERSPGDPLVHNDLGNVYYEQGDLVRSVQEFQAAVRLKPDYAKAYNNLGAAYDALDRDDEAIGAYREALRWKPAYAEALMNLGNSCRKTGRYEEALSLHTRTLTLPLDPLTEAVAHYNLGMDLLRTGRLSEAAQEFELSLKRKPDFPEARRELRTLRGR